MPPSENHTGRIAAMFEAVRVPPVASWSVLSTCDVAVVLAVRSTSGSGRTRPAGSCSGTALTSSGKLRLMRVATSTGSWSSAGSG